MPSAKQYDIIALAKQIRHYGRGSRLKLPPIEERITTVYAYRRVLIEMVKQLAVETRVSVIPAYRVPTYIGDADDNMFQRLRALALTLAQTSGETVSRILRLESIRHTETFMDDARKVLGIDLRGIVQQEDLGDYLRTAITRNTGLIKSLSDDTVKRVEQAVIDNELNGRSAAKLRKVLVEEFGIAERRARLIAQDQTAKLNADMNRIRQEQAGIDKYGWLTSRDERVRPLHRALDGREYKWGESTGAEGGLPPGQPIRCRCVAQAVVEF